MVVWRMSEFTELALADCEDILVDLLSTDRHFAMIATSYGYNKPPETYCEAQKHRNWDMFRRAMDQEYESLRKMQAWNECLLPKGRKVIDVR
jgi:hypothetical protein